MNRDRWINWALFVLLALIWGSSFILMKIGREALNGFQIGATRIFAAGVVLLPAALFHITRIPIKKFAFVVLSGLLGNLFPALLFGVAIEHHMDSALAGILNSLTPLCVILIAILFFKASFRRRVIFGVLIGFAGLVLLSLAQQSSNGGNPLYSLLILLATICYGLNVNVVGHFLKGIDPVKLATVSLALMTIPAAVVMMQQQVFSIARYDSAAFWPLAAVVLLGIVGSAIATVLFYVLIRRAGGLFASLVTYATPVVAVGWGLLAHERVTLLHGLCLLLILAGVFLVTKRT